MIRSMQAIIFGHISVFHETLLGGRPLEWISASPFPFSLPTYYNYSAITSFFQPLYGLLLLTSIFDKKGRNNCFSPVSQYPEFLQWLENSDASLSIMISYNITAKDNKHICRIYIPSICNPYMVKRHYPPCHRYTGRTLSADNKPTEAYISNIGPEALPL